MSPITQAHSDANRQGVIPLPTDTGESYLARVKASFPVAIPKALNVYDLEPAWVSIEYSNKDIMPWEAACTWYSDSADEPPVIQMRSSFENKNVYLGIYGKEEILAHEYVHAVRHALHSTYFEEIFAYYLSPSIFRRLLGPLFEKPWESSLLLLLLLISPWSIWPAILFLGYLLLRLSYRWWQWLSCKRKLSKLLGSQKSLYLMVRLLDEEIILFSHMKPETISLWIEEQRSFRWQLLQKSYFFS